MQVGWREATPLKDHPLPLFLPVIAKTGLLPTKKNGVMEAAAVVLVGGGGMGERLLHPRFFLPLLHSCGEGEKNKKNEEEMEGKETTREEEGGEGVALTILHTGVNALLMCVRGEGGSKTPYDGGRRRRREKERGARAGGTPQEKAAAAGAAAAAVAPMIKAR